MKQFIKEKWNAILYIAFLLVVFAFLFIHGNNGEVDYFKEWDSIDVSQGWKYESGDGLSGVTKLPYSIDEWEKSDYLRLENTLPDIPETMSFFFKAKHTTVIISVDGEVRLDTMTGRSEKSYWYDMSGIAFREIKVTPEDSGKTIVIESKSPMKRYIRSPGDVYLGDRGTFVLSLFRAHFKTILCAIVLFILGVILFILWFVNAIVLKNDTSEILYLSLFSTTVGLWLVTESDCAQFFMKNTGPLTALAYETLMLMPLPLALYFEAYSDREHARKGARIATIAPITLFVVNNLLHTFRIVPLSESLLATQLMLGAELIYISYIQITEIYYKRVVKEKYSVTVWMIPLLGVAILVPLALADVVQYAFLTKHRFGNGGILISIGVIAYMCALACDCVVRMNYRSERYKESSDIKTQFLANMSHEIRTPLNAILGFNEIIIRKSRSKIIKNYALEIQSAGNNLKSIINSILDISKIESGKLEIYSVEYNTVGMLDGIVSMFETLAKKKGLTLITDIDPRIPETLIGDENHLTQVITNIMSNAVKYTESGSVCLRLRLVDLPEDTPICKIAVIIKDTGIGIKEEDLSKLFEKFSRFDRERNYSVEGTGLGMNIVVQLLQAMGSDIKVDSVYGEGSTFSFEIVQSVVNRNPIGLFNERRNERSGDSASKFDFIAPQAEVLIVDDVQMNLDTASALLEQYEVKIDTASCGKDAIEKIKNKHYDLVFMDHMMPEMDGVQATEYIRNLAVEREDVYFASLPIIALTANAVVGMKEHFLQAGMQDFVSKPIEVPVLNEAIKKWLPKEKIVPVKRDDTVDEKETEETLDDWGKVPEGFNRENAKKFCPSYDLFITNIRTYAGSCDATSEKLRKFRDDNDTNNYMIVVHGLKSTSKMIGKNDISEFALTQEMYCRNNLPELVWPETEALLGMYKESCDKIKEFLGMSSSGEGSGESIANDDYIALMKKIKEAAENFDMGVFMELEEELSKVTPPSDLTAEFETVKTLVANAEFGEVEEVLKNY